ncbi:MAG: ABC transporter permease [Candidatus Aminicenantes bacterium]|nr:ABC transporter permease [Candidatus Aminicenantes bacterium]
MEKNLKSLMIPRTFSIENVSALFAEIKDLDTDTPLQIDLKDMEDFDSSGIAFFNYLKKNFPHVSFSNVRPAVQKALDLFAPCGETDGRGHGHRSVGERLTALGGRAFKFEDSLKKFLVLLVDEIYHSFQYLLKRRGVYPGEILNQLYFMAYNSFPIVTLICFLIGITISITSAEQLRSFGADIYLADLVGFGMVRELVPLMTGIILAGKIGASITAEISSMKVLEEVDALKTMGLIPEKFLMVPRLTAITLAVPLLVVLADLVGILGGVIVGWVVSGIPPGVFFREMFTVVELSDFFIGLMKTLVFGWIVVISSGYKGFSVERGAVGVGIATTESVVLSISLIIVSDCVFALFLY